MFHAIVDLQIHPATLDAAHTQLLGERPEVLAIPGCRDFRVLGSVGAPNVVTVLHEWEDENSFGAYLSSAAFARSGAVLGPLMSAPPVSRRFHSRLVETV